MNITKILIPIIMGTKILPIVSWESYWMKIWRRGTFLIPMQQLHINKNLLSGKKYKKIRDSTSEQSK
jgi:hypothetical protein